MTFIMRTSLTLAATVLVAATAAFAATPAVAAEPTPSSPASAAADSLKAATPTPSAPAPAAAPAPAPAASQPPVKHEKPLADLNAVRAKGRSLDATEKESAEKSFKETVSDGNMASAKRDTMETASRLAAQFGGIPELYLGERSRLKAGWGELAVAHTILENSKSAIPIDQIFDLRTEGMGWGEIAHGLDLNVGEIVSASRSKGKAALGSASAAGMSEAMKTTAPGLKTTSKQGTKSSATSTGATKSATKSSTKSSTKSTGKSASTGSASSKGTEPPGQTKK